MKKFNAIAALGGSAEQPQNSAVVEGGEVFDDAMGGDEEQKQAERKRGREMGLISDHFADAAADQGTAGAAETPQPEDGGITGYVRGLMGANKPTPQPRGRQGGPSGKQPRTSSVQVQGVAPQMFARGRRGGPDQAPEQTRGREAGAAGEAGRGGGSRRESSLTGLNLRSGLYSLLGYAQQEETPQPPQLSAAPGDLEAGPQTFESRIPRAGGVPQATGGAVGIASKL